MALAMSLMTLAFIKLTIRRAHMQSTVTTILTDPSVRPASKVKKLVVHNVNEVAEPWLRLL